MKHLRVLAITVLVAAVCAPTYAGTGTLRFYADKNNNGAYDAGEEIGSNKVYYSQPNVTVQGWCSANGTFQYSNAAKDHKLYCRALVYSHSPAGWKGDRAAYAGSMFDVYMDTDSVDGSGNIQRRKLTAAEAQTLNNGGTVNVRLGHPVISWNLVVAFNWDANASYRTKLASGIAKASKYIFDCTDGHMKIGRVDIRNNAAGTATWTTNADVQVYHSNKWPSTTACWSCLWTTNFIMMPWRFNRQNADSGDPDGSDWYKTFCHEFGHCALGFDEEYRSGNGTQADWTWYRFWHHGDCTWNYGVMDNQYGSSEMSSNNDYRIAISMPPDGTYNGTDFWGSEQRSSSARRGPTSIPTDFYGLPCWTDCDVMG